jgi:hypothetical protein
VSASPFGPIHADAWAEPGDLASINQAASDLVLARIEEIRTAGATEGAALPSASVLLLGPAGAGKTHLFTRLRRRAGRRAVFIHTRPQIGVEPTPRFVLHSILDSLKQKVFGEEQMQLDVIAGAMLAAHERGEARYPLLAVDDARRLDEEARRALVERVVGEVEDRFPGIAPDYLERLLAVPFASRPERRALLAWLSGREPSMVELERLGAPGPLADVDVMRALATLGVAAAYGAPVVLVFDQLENLAEDGGRTGRIHAHARLVSDLRDTVRGLVIVQMALDAEWVTRIHPALHASDRDRLEEKVVHLALPSPEERRSLLEAWREALPEDARDRPFPHPFPAAEVDRWIHDRGMTPRMLMQAASEAWLRRMEPGEAVPESATVDTAPSLDERLTAQWEAAIERARGEIDEAATESRGVLAERLASGISAALSLVGVDATQAATKLGPRIDAQHEGARFEVLVAQQQNHRSLAAAIRAATGAASSKRVRLVRERAAAIPPTWKEVDGLLTAFEALPGAALVWASRDDVARLLALEGFLTAARSHDLSDDEGRPVPAKDAIAWAERALETPSWPILEALLVARQKSGQVPVPVPVPGSGRGNGSGNGNGNGNGNGSGSENPPELLTGGARPAQAPRRAARQGPASLALARLCVASVDRVVREAQVLDPSATRSTVVDELRRGGARFFGASIVALSEGSS